MSVSAIRRYQCDPTHVLDVRDPELAVGWALAGSDLDSVILHTGNELQPTTIIRAARRQTGTMAALQITYLVLQTPNFPVPRRPDRPQPTPTQPARSSLSSKASARFGLPRAARVSKRTRAS